MSRTAAAWLTLAIWALVLGWNASRELFRPEAELLALGAATLPPGAAYYRIDAGDRPAGMASVEIDTLPARAGFHVTEQVTLRLPGLGPEGRTEIRAETWLGPGVTLDSLTHRTVHGGATLVVRAVVRGDSLRWEGPADTLVRPLPAAGAVQTASTWPLRFAAAGGAEPGSTRRIALLDPVTGALRDVDLRTLEEERRVVTDSADTDPRTGEWVVAGRDTVLAWLVERGETSATAGASGVPSAAWVDEDGRYVEADLPGGLRMRRTAFELAFFREDG